jgi:hypothetical protein
MLHYPKGLEYVYEYGEAVWVFGAVPERSGGNSRLLGGAATMLGHAFPIGVIPIGVDS